MKMWGFHRGGISISFKVFFCVCCGLLFSVQCWAQQVVEGTIYDASTGETLIGATVVIKGTTEGTTTGINGEFSLEIDKELPVTLQIGYVGYSTQEIEVSDVSEEVRIELGADEVVMEEIEVVGQRISEKQKQAPLTVESMDVIAIKEAPSGNFYEGLGNLKEVDLTSASLGFKVLNTRGFNSTSPVRSLQLIDGVDNQSPGLNFSLGNFLGASDLDVMKVDVIAGASSAFYGPGAFNGVIKMTSKNPFVFPGLSASIKGGERSLTEAAVRWADVIRNEEGEEKFAYKFNVFYLTANDWEATNYDPSFDSETGRNNPGGYDAINIYGDEGINAVNNDFSSITLQAEEPGLGQFFRTGYREEDLVDYNVENLKLSTSLHYRFQPDLELSYNARYARGNTVYQGDNRYRLDNIQFIQNHIELRKEDKYFVRFYSTHEDAGDTYDIVQTAFLMNQEARQERDWNSLYSLIWSNVYTDRVEGLPGFQPYNSEDFESRQVWVNDFLQPFLQQYQDSLVTWHNDTRDRTDNASLDGEPRYEPGTARFDSLFNDITSRNFSEGGSRFYDKSALYHGQAEYKFKPEFATFTLGVDGRLYTPDSRGTIFSDTLEYTRERNENGELVRVDSSYRQITNYQFGVYAGIDKSFIDDKLKANATIRIDKNENFDAVFSPALSLVYTMNENNTFRATVSSAVRNPTMSDQFLYYDVGRAILLGNVDGAFEEGVDSLITPESFDDYRNSVNLITGLDELEYMNIDAIQPERARTYELGYRGTLFGHLYLDLSGYYSVYRDFIGYIIGIDAEFQSNGYPVPGSIQPYRVTANAQDIVTTRGVSLGFNYYFSKFTFSGNYSYNELISGDDDPIIPAYNTPENKFNVGLSGRDIELFNLKNWGFSTNYKWVQGFLFEGSPQFSGFIDDYGLVDAQINYTLKFKENRDMTCQLKLGASNLLDNQVFQVYGGPTVGRLAYFSVLFEWNRR